MSTELEVDAPQASSVNLSDYLGVFTRRTWLIAIPFLVVLAASATLAFLLPAQYKASTRVKVEQLGFLERFYQRTGFTVPPKPFLVTISEEVRRRSFLEDLIQKFGITEGFDTHNRKERQQLLERVLKNLVVSYSETKDGSDLFGFTYVGRDGPRTARFVNGIRAKYENYIQTKIVNVVSRAKTLQMARKREAERAYDKATDAIRRFESRSDYSLSDAKAYDEKVKLLEGVRAQLQNDQIELKGQQAQLEQVRFQLRNTQPVMVEETEESNPEYLKAVVTVAWLHDGLNKLKETLTDAHPKVQRAKEALERAEDYQALVPPFVPKSRTPQQNPVYNELEAARLTLGRRVSTLDAEVKRRGALVAKLSEQVNRIPRVRAELERLRMRRDTAASRFRAVERTLSQAEATYERVISKENSIFSLLSAPTPEEARDWDPVFPNVGLFIGAGALVGLLLGVGLAFLAEFSNQSYVSASQARRLLPVPLLGQVAAIRTQADRKSTLRRRFVVGGVALVLVGILVWVHVAYFTQSLQENLPPWLFDFLKRIYGSR